MPTRPLLGALLLAAAGTAFAGTDDSITYRGVALGATQEEYAAKLPDHRCRPAEGVCRFVLQQCRRAEPGGRPPSDCATRNALFGAQVTATTAEFRERRLVALSFELDPSQVGRLATALEERFGAPTPVEVGPTAAAGGRSMARRDRVWTRTDWEMRLEPASGRPPRAAARLVSAKEAERQNTERAERAKVPAKGT